MSNPAPPPLRTAELRAWLARLAAPVEGSDGSSDDGGMLDEVALLEQLKGACAARQARVTVAFDASQRRGQREAGVPRAQVGRGVAEQVALARRESPTRGSRHLGLAKALVHELPQTLQALSDGQISEWTAMVVARETACLTADDRRRVDAELGGRLAAMSTRRVQREAWAAACGLDPAAAVTRRQKAVGQRHVGVRPAPDAMTYLTALLPVEQGVAVYAALTAAAGAATAGGDPRSRGQLMADTLVERLTGLGQPAGGPPASAVEVCLVMTTDALLGGGQEPALVTTTDPRTSNPAGDLVPAGIARDLVREAGTAFVRRVFAEPGTGQLVAMDSSRRVFDGNLRRMLVLRDQACRTPWCDAPVRHGDHVVPHADGGLTSLHNGQGLCERCNQTKNLPGWSAEVLSNGRDGPHVVRTTTPAGRAYDSTAPPLLSQRAS